MRDPWSFFALAGSFVVACSGTTSSPVADGDDSGTADASGDASRDAGGDAHDAAPPHTTTHDCAPSCGAGRYCAYPQGPGFCPMGGGDSGFCNPGCPGCPPLPPPACAALPAACGGTPSCACLLSTCSSFGGECAIDADGDWVIGCISG